MNHRDRYLARWTAAMAVAASLLTITACGTSAGPSRAPGLPASAHAASCPAEEPVLATPRDGTPTPTLSPGAITATICQYAPSLTGAKASSAPMRRIVLTGQAADGLRAVLSGTDPMTAQAARCGSGAEMLPVQQVIYLGYRDGRAARAAVTYTSCQLADVMAAGDFGVLPAPIQDDLFGYTLVTAHDQGSAVPDVIGLAAAQAAHAAARAGFTVVVDGQAVDPAVPFGTVIFQVLPPAVRDPGPGPYSLGTIVAVGAAADCQARQLRLSYRGGSAGAGSDFGQIMFQDLAAAPCRLAGPLSLTGVSATGQPVTNTVAAVIAGPGILGPRTAPVPDGMTAPPGSMVYAWWITAEYRDDATSPNGLCADHVIPASWHLRLPGGILMTIPNTDKAGPFRLLGGSGGLVTCRGRFSAMSTAEFAG